MADAAQSESLRNASAAAASLTTRATLYARVRDCLRAEIQGGHYADHAGLPSESAIGERFGVSRITVRHALSELQREKLIYTVNGKGTFVEKPKAQQSLQRLEGFGEAMSRLGYESTNRVLRMRVVPAPARVAPRLAVAPGKPITELVWVRNLDGQPFCYEVSYLPQDIGDLLSPDALQRRDMFAMLEQDHRIRLGQAELSIEAVSAKRAHARWLGIGAGKPCLRIERLTRTAQGRPINLDYLHFSGDAFRYSLSIARDYETVSSPSGSNRPLSDVT